MQKLRRLGVAPGPPLSRRSSNLYIKASGSEGKPRAETVLNMLDKVYNARILELAGNIPRIGRLARPDATAKAYSKLCGSTITVDLTVQEGKVTDYAHELKACALGQASASIMARNVVGSTPQELREAREALRRMLKENGPPPEGKWADLAVLEPVRDYKARHGSTMLAFDAVVEAIEQAEAAQEKRGERV